MAVAVWIRAADETPRCGSGRRLVVAEIGRKWARLRPAARPHSRPDRIPVATFENLKDQMRTPALQREVNQF